MVAKTLIVAAVLGAIPLSAELDNGSLSDVGFVRPGQQISVRLYGSDRGRIGGHSFIRVAATFVPEAGWPLFEDIGIDTLHGVVQDGRALAQGMTLPSDDGLSWHVWYDTWATDSAGTRCASSEDYLDASGELKGGSISWCEAVDADPIGSFPWIGSKLDDGSLSIRWGPIADADSFGVLLWEDVPDPSDLLQGLRVVSPVLSSDQQSLELAWNEESYTVGVWASNVHGPELGVSVFPYYVLGFVSSDRPTVVDSNTWGSIKILHARD